MLVTTRLNKVEELDLLEETALVGAGLVNLELQKYLEPYGYMFPPDLASQKMAKVASTPEERDRLWLARRSGNRALGRLKLGFIVQDVTMPLDKLPQMLTLVQEVARKYNLLIVQMAHVGDGNPHPHILYDLSDEGERQWTHEASREIFNTVLASGRRPDRRTWHRPGKMAFMELRFTGSELEVMGNLGSWYGLYFKADSPA